jgi:hypothetical protein
MTDFLLLFRNDNASQSNLSPEAMQQHMQQWRAWMGELVKSGNFKSGEPLERTGKVLRGKSKIVTDGPYAESKDLVGGYLMITAENIDHAVELSRGCPIFETDGIVEVRPVGKLEM